MKLIKIKKTDYKDVVKMYKRLGMVSTDGKRAFPQCVYWSSNDLKILEKELIKQFKKQYNGNISKRHLDYSVGMMMLDLAPSTLESGLKGYMVVDTYRKKALEEEYKNENQTT